MNLGIIVDSSCGLSKIEAESRGWAFLPLYINIDGKEYLDGIDLHPKEFYEMITPKMNVRTSATPTGIILNALEKASKEFDAVIVYALSGGLSSQTSNISLLASEFDNVAVIESEGIGIPIVRSVENIISFANEGHTLAEILEFGNADTRKIKSILVPQNMDWLVAGGRVSPAAAKMAGMLKIVPVISFSDGKLTKYGKGRVFEKTLIKSFKSLRNKINYTNNQWIILHAGSDVVEKIALDVKKELGIDTIEIVYIPPVIGIHTGKGAICILSMSKKI